MRAEALIAVATFVFLTACDISQKRPETAPVHATPGSREAIELKRSWRSSIEAPAATEIPGPTVEAKPSDGKSIRLFGPGVSRKRQIRV